MTTDPSEDLTEDSPGADRSDAQDSSTERDVSGLEPGRGARKIRAEERRRRARAAARRVLRELPPSLARLGVIRRDILRMAQVEIVYQDAFDRIAEGSPVDAKGEMKESVRRLLDTAEKLHSWVADLTKAFPVPPAPQHHVVTFEYEDPLEREVTAATTPAAAAGNGVDGVEPPIEGVSERHRPGGGEREHRASDPPAPPSVTPTPETYTLDTPTPASPGSMRRREERDPNDWSDRLGWSGIAQDDDDD